MHIINLASGSKANSTFIEYEDTKILVDIGLSERELKKKLELINKNIEEINGICITHEHSDHIKGLKAVAKKYNIDIFIHKKLWDSGFIRELNLNNDKVHTFENDKFYIKNIEVQPFDISHDAIAPVGFVFNVKSSKSKFGIMTDTGIALSSAVEFLKGSKIVFLESNYDEEMLINGFYPEKIKSRIASKMGHLSNNQSLEIAKILFEFGTKCFVLSHISQNNNSYEIAYSNYVSYFESQGKVLDKDVFVRLSYQEKHGNNFYLKEEF